MGWRFYVYALLNSAGQWAYVGKGSGRRLKAQMKSFGLQGQEIARFHSEKDAYAFERRMIAEMAPALNRHPGGNGSRATPVRRGRQPAWIREIEAVGTRAYSARILLGVYRVAPQLIDPSKIDEIRRVAYG